MPGDRLDEGLEQTWSPGWAAVVVVIMLVESGMNVYANAIEGAWLDMTFAGLLPLAAAWSWWRLRKHSPVARAVADHMLVYVMLALGLYAWVVWP